VNSDIWQQLVHGKRLDRARLPKINGRIDVRNLHLAEPHPIKVEQTPRFNVVHLGGITDIRGAKWQSIDFSSSQLAGLRLFDCHIEDCIFDNCRIPDMRIWGTKFSNVSFRGASLRDSSLGGVEHNGERPAFRNVDFTNADLRDIACHAAVFVGCWFINTKLDKVDFQSSNFTDCLFQGELREVLFYRRGWEGEQFSPNEMTRVDLRHATLRWSEFRGLDLDNILFPEDSDHIVVHNFPLAVDHLLGHFGGGTDLASRRLYTFFENKRRWLGPRQKVGVLNKQDLMQMGGEDGLRTVMKIIESVQPAPSARQEDISGRR